MLQSLAVVTICFGTVTLLCLRDIEQASFPSKQFNGGVLNHTTPLTENASLTLPVSLHE